MPGKLAMAAVAAGLSCVVACAPVRPPAPGPGPIWQSGASDSFIELADALRSQWLWVSRRGETDLPVLSARGEVMQVEREMLLVFDYPDAESRAEESATIADGGRRIGSRDVHWPSEPHVFTRGTMIVIHLGTDDEILAALSRFLDPPHGHQPRTVKTPDAGPDLRARTAPSP